MNINCIKFKFKYNLFIILFYIYYINKISNSPFSTEYFFNETNLWCQSFLGKIIYPDLKNPPLHLVKKSSTNLFSVYDSFMINKKNSDVYKIYNEGIKKMQNEFISKNWI